MSALLIADHDKGALKQGTARAMTALLAMTDAVDILVAGEGVDGVAAEAARLEGVRSVLVADAPQLAAGLPEALSKTVAALAADYTHVFFVSNTTAKAAMPRVAALLDVEAVSDVQKVIDAKTFERAIYAGSLLETVAFDQDRIVGTIRATAFEAVGEAGAAAPVRSVEAAPADDRDVFVAFHEQKSDRPELVSARVVVGGGRGLHDEAGFKALEELADVMNAAVGATRTAVDMGLCPNDWQIGQTGKMIAPELYIAFGISGAIQHTAGIKDAKVVVAVNEEAEEPIFEVADIGLVADAASTIAELKSKLG